MRGLLVFFSLPTHPRTRGASNPAAPSPKSWRNRRKGRSRGRNALSFESLQERLRLSRSSASRGAAWTRRVSRASLLRCSTWSFAESFVVLAAVSLWHFTALDCSTTSCAFKEASSTAEFEESVEMSLRLVWNMDSAFENSFAGFEIEGPHVTLES